MRTCPFCGTENEPFFRFCLGCGEDLDKAFAPAPAPEPPKASREPSRELAAVRPGDAPRAAPAAGVGSPPSRAGVRRPTSSGLRGDDATETELPAAPAASRAPDARPVTAGPASQAPGRDAPPREPASRRVRRRLVRASLVQVFDDGTEESVAELGAAPLVIGRSADAATPEEGPWAGASEVLGFPDDDFLAARHVVLALDFDAVLVEPLPSTNGIFLQIDAPHLCGDGATFRVGQQLLQVDRLDSLTGEGARDAGLLGSPLPENAWGRLAQVITPDHFGDVHLLGGAEVRLGRERGDINFGGDLFVSGLHAVLRMSDEGIVLEDLDSSNGTYVRLDGPTRLSGTASILVGQQLFRIDIDEE
jgi:hypothetical protein